MHSMMRLLVASLFALLLRGTTEAQQHSSARGIWPFDATDGRLPATLRPYHYNVEFIPNIYIWRPPFPFGGHVDIYIDCLVDTSAIIINSRGLTIDETTISVSVSPDTPGSPPDPGFFSFTENTDHDFLYFIVQSNLVAGEKYILSLDFTGTLRSDNGGLYYDSYITDDGGVDGAGVGYLVATQFESIEARTAFPCFDEPDLKATFNVTVVRDSAAIVLANSPILTTDSRPGGYFADTFQQTPIMSNYLLSFAIGDFRPIISGNINGYQVRIWSRPDLLDQMHFAADVAAQFQAWLDAETGITYREPKMDHIALPSKGGAMENWGLITYGEESIAVNPATTPATQRLNVATIIAHEIAHHWYGNLVTAKWWTEIWLNEGFATNYNYFPTDSIGWEGSRLQQIDPRRGVQYFFDVDSKNTSDPVRKEINTVWEADNSFSGSTYPKGGAMIRHIRAILSKETFNRGMTRYLNEHEYTGVTTDDYWQALTDQAAIDGVTNPDGSALDVKARMDPWLNQLGYPLVTFTRGSGDTGTVSRTHFLNPVNQVVETPSPWDYAWDVPITVVTSAHDTWDAWDDRPVAWIDIGQTGTTLTGLPTDGGWVIINAKQNFFYRVLYDGQSLNAISTQLDSDHLAIDAESRSAIIDDTFTLSSAGYLNITYALDNTRYLDREFVYNAWGSVLKHFQRINRIFRTESWFSTFQSYVVSKSAPVNQQFGWVYTDSEPILTQYLRRDAISTACSYGDASCLTTAREQYAIIAAAPESNGIDPNNLPTALCVGVSEGSSGDWTLWFNEYLSRRTSQIRDERYAYLFGLSCTTDTVLLDEYLDEITVLSNIAPRDRNTATQYLAVLDYGGSILWNYLDANWDSVREGINKWTTLNNIIAGYSTEAQATELNSFIGRHPPQSESERNNFAQLVLRVEQNIAWRTNSADDLGDWLASQPLNDVHLASGYKMTTSAVHHWATVVDAHRADYKY